MGEDKTDYECYRNNVLVFKCYGFRLRCNGGSQQKPGA